MSDKRMNDVGVNPAKRQKMDPTNNPYLAHMQQPDDTADEGGYEIGFTGDATPNLKATSNGSGQPKDHMKGMKRHATTTNQAKSAEDGPANPFNGNQLSERYFGILKTRRNLPVHAQRYVMATWRRVRR